MAVVPCSGHSCVPCPLAPQSEQVMSAETMAKLLVFDLWVFVLFAGVCFVCGCLFCVWVFVLFVGG